MTEDASAASVARTEPPNIVVIVVLFVLLGFGLAGFGLYTLYDDSYSAKVVGGDAYNHIIYGTRGTAWVCAGIASLLIAVVLAIYDVYNRLK